MATLEERLKRHAVEDQLYLGKLCEDALGGDFGTLVKAVTTGLHAEWLAQSEVDAKMNADRYLGRLEGVNKLLDRLEYMIEAKARLEAEQQKSQEVEAPGAETTTGP